jgi:hypothetical protein
VNTPTSGRSRVPATYSSRRMATCWAMATSLESPCGLPEDLVGVTADVRPPPPSDGAAPPGRAKPQVGPVTPGGGSMRRSGGSVPASRRTALISREEAQAPAARLYHGLIAPSGAMSSAAPAGYAEQDAIGFR